MKLLIYFFVSVLMLLSVSCLSQRTPIESLSLDTDIKAASIQVSDSKLYLASSDKVYVLPLNKDENNRLTTDIDNISVNAIFCHDYTCWLGGGEHQDGKLLVINDLRKDNQKLWGAEKFSEVYSLVFSKNTSTIITGHANGEIILWDSISGHAKNKFGDYNSEIYSLLISDDGRRIYSGKSSGGIDCWDLSNSKRILLNSDIEGSIFTLATSKKSKSVVAGGSSGVLYVLDKENLLTKTKVQFGKESILSCDISKEDGHIVCGLTNGYAGIVSQKEMTLKIHKLHNDNILFVKFLDRNKILTVSKDGVVKIWDASILDY